MNAEVAASPHFRCPRAEYIGGKHTASFRDAYDDVVAARAHPSWQDAYNRLRLRPDEYRYFDAGQIIKHYLGLKTDRAGWIGGRPVTLLYLFWEPTDVDDHRLFAHHRDEIAHFASALSDAAIEFRASSYAELWDDWRKRGINPDHVDAPARRYSVRLANS